MSFPLITLELIARIEAFHLTFNRVRAAALEAIPGNPYQVETREFGSAVAFKAHSPLLRGKNRVHNLRGVNADALPDILNWFRSDELNCSIYVPHGQMTRELFRQLGDAGLWSNGSGTVPYIVPDREQNTILQSAIYKPDLPLRIREANDGENDKTLYLDLFRQSFAHRGEGCDDYLRFQWAEDTLPGCCRYIAEVAGESVGMASFPVFDGVGFFGTAGVLPDWRGRGIQMALIQRRLKDAPALGCELVIGGGSLFSAPHRNFERAGLRLVPLGSGWADTWQTIRSA